MFKKLVKRWRLRRAVHRELQLVRRLTSEAQRVAPVTVPISDFTVDIGGYKMLNAGSFQCPVHLHVLGAMRDPTNRDCIKIDPCSKCIEEAEEKAREASVHAV